MFTSFSPFLVTCISQAEEVVQKSIHEVDNPAISAVTCTPGMELICVKSALYIFQF
jgi:hypothetical protein